MLSVFGFADELTYKKFQIRKKSYRQHKSKKHLSLFIFVLKFENLLLFFNFCGDFCTIISPRII